MVACLGKGTHRTKGVSKNKRRDAHGSRDLRDAELLCQVSSTCAVDSTAHVNSDSEQEYLGSEEGLLPLRPLDIYESTSGDKIEEQRTYVEGRLRIVRAIPVNQFGVVVLANVGERALLSISVGGEGILVLKHFRREAAWSLPPRPSV